MKQKTKKIPNKVYHLNDDEARKEILKQIEEQSYDGIGRLIFENWNVFTVTDFFNFELHRENGNLYCVLKTSNHYVQRMDKIEFNNDTDSYIKLSYKLYTRIARLLIGFYGGKNRVPIDDISLIVHRQGKAYGIKNYKVGWGSISEINSILIGRGNGDTGAVYSGSQQKWNQLKKFIQS